MASILSRLQCANIGRKYVPSFLLTTKLLRLSRTSWRGWRKLWNLTSVAGPNVSFPGKICNQPSSFSKETCSVAIDFIVTEILGVKIIWHLLLSVEPMAIGNCIGIVYILFSQPNIARSASLRIVISFGMTYYHHSISKCMVCLAMYKVNQISLSTCTHACTGNLYRVNIIKTNEYIQYSHQCT